MAEEHEHNHSHANPLANLDEETQKQIHELQMLEQNYQQIAMQKQAFRAEVNETDLALREIEKAEGDVFKIVANQVVIKTSKEKLKEELDHKKELIDMRLKNIEGQEKEFSEKINSIRDEVLKKIQPK